MRVGRQIERSLTALVHEILEWRVSTLLELHAIVKTLLEHIIHLLLEFEQLFGEINGVFQKILVLHYSPASCFDVWIHLLNYKDKSVWISLEDIVHEIEFLESCMLEHIRAASFFLDHWLCFLSDQLLLNNFYYLSLGLSLQPKVCIVFFMF